MHACLDLHLCECTFPILYSHVQANVQKSIGTRYPKTTAASMERDHVHIVAMRTRSACKLTTSLSLANYNNLALSILCS